jgi:hypothetical protein
MMAERQVAEQDRTAIQQQTNMTPDNHTVPRNISEMVSIGKEKAIELYETRWWEGKRDTEIAGFCLAVRELCCPFDVLHQSLENSLGRPVWTHELGLNLQGILNEFHGTESAPTFEQIVELIPAEKRIVVS